ncbi:MAG: carboxypeptidase regulatory-like domain-containing protein [Archangium sp.]
MLAVLALVGCRDLAVPAPPGPGSVQGTLVHYRPGRAAPQPAVGARVSLRNSSVTAVANAQGNFRLEPVTQTSGELQFAFDLDADGVVDRQRTMTLEEIGTGPGRDIVLGTVTLGENAAVAGRARRSELGASLSGHAGTSVVIPEAPYATVTADDGSFLLPELPEGDLRIAFVRSGYEVVVSTFTARAGEELNLTPVVLQPLSTTPSAGRIIGRVLDGLGAPISMATVSVAAAGMTVAQVTSDEDGRFVFSALNAGLYDLGVGKSGFTTLVIHNVIRAEGDTDVGDLLLGAGTSTAPDFTPLPGLDGGTTIIGGTGPIAVISPAHIAVALDPPDDGGTVIDFEVNGDLSMGVAPLRYEWTAGTIDLLVDQPSEFSSHVRFYWGVPQTAATQAEVRLVVSDVTGTSQRVTAPVYFAYRPSAVVSPAVAAVSNAVILTSTASTDPQGLPIVARRFGLVTGAAEIQAGVTPEERRVVAHAPGPVEVFLEVENSVGVVSRRVTSRITFTSGSDAGSLFTDAGALQTVDAGSLVQLTGSVLSSEPSFSQLWTEVMPQSPSITIASPTSVSTSFLAPVVVGDQLRRFRLEARSPAGCLTSDPDCRSSASETQVIITDVHGPGSPVFTTDQVNSYSRFAAIDVTFDEPIGPVATASLINLNTNIPVPTSTLRVAPSRLRIFPTRALLDNATYRLTVDVVDQSPRANPSTVATTFIARNAQLRTPVTATLESTSTDAPHPSVLLKEPSSLYVAARIINLAPTEVAIFEPYDVSPSVPPGAPLQRWDAGVQVGLKKVPTSKKLLQVGNTIYAGLATPDGAWSPTPTGSALFAATSSGWAQVVHMGSPTAMPGPIFTDGASLFTAAATNNVLVTRFTPATQQWSDFVSQPSTAENVDTLAASSGPGVLKAAGDTFNGTRYLAWQNPGSLQLKLSRSSAANVWTASTVVSLAEPLTGVRTAVSDGVEYVAYSRFLGGSNTLEVRGGASFSTYAVPTLPPGVLGFDLVASGKYVWLTAATGNGIFVWRKSALASEGAFELVDGPFPGDALNDATCAAANPELSGLATGPWITWAERCGANPWQLVVTKLE